MAGTTAKTGSERRRPFFRRAGHGLAIWIALLFAYMTGKTIYQSDNWKAHYFRDVLRSGDACDARVAGAGGLEDEGRLASAAFTPIVVPHGRGTLGERTADLDPFYVVEYRCRINLREYAPGRGATYLHLGWVFGERLTVDVDGVRRFEGMADDKPVIPLLPRDLAAPALALTVKAAGRSLAQLGMAGEQPLAVVSGTVANFAIFGLETALDLTLDLQRLMPLLTLGVVLGFAWLLGVRTRVIVAGFFYLAMAATDQVWTLSKDFLPFDLLKVHVIASPFAYGGAMAALLVAMEVLGLWKRAIYPAMLVLAVLAPAMALLFALYPGVPAGFVGLGYLMKGLTAALGAVLTLRGVQAFGREPPGPQRRVRGLMLGILAIYAAVFAWELAALGFGVHVYLGSYMQLVLPLFLAGALIYAQKQGSDQLAVERRHKTALADDLALGRAAQDLLVPTVRHLTHPGYRFELFHEARRAMGGSWSVHWTDRRGRLHVCLGEVAGAGPQAALVVAAITAVLKLCEFEERSLDLCISRIHTVLGEQFHRYVTTTLSAVSVGPERDAEIYNYGGPGFLLLGRDGLEHLPLHGTELGGAPVTAHGRLSLRLAPSAALVLFSDAQLRDERMMQRLVQAAAPRWSALTDVGVLFDVAKEAVAADERDLNMAVVAAA